LLKMRELKSENDPRVFPRRLILVWRPGLVYGSWLGALEESDSLA
jgi:hypothetical protein